MVSLMDGTRTLSEISADIIRRFPQTKGEEVLDGVRELWANGLLEDAGLAPHPGLTKAELERYARSRNFFGHVLASASQSPDEVQARLKVSSVAVLGLGGIGSVMAMALAACGVGRLTCVDFDRIQLSDLNRQVYFDERSVGRSKASAIKRRIRALNSSVKVEAFDRRIVPGEWLEDLVRRHDLVVDAMDESADLTFLLSDIAFREDRPILIAGYTGPRVSIGLFVPGRTPCIRCVVHDHEEMLAKEQSRDESELFADNPRPNATIAPSSGIAANFAALEAIYFLGGMNAHCVGRMFHQSLVDYSNIQYSESTAWPDCPGCKGVRAKIGSVGGSGSSTIPQAA
jgi:molybdopterin/thiamine biosynthesis adenylyltransferase